MGGCIAASLSPPPGKRAMRAIVLLCGLAAALVIGCRSTDLELRSASAAQAERAVPLVVDDNRLLSEKESVQVVRRLTSEGDTDLLARHLLNARGEADSPLVLGNNARLLVDGPTTHEAMFRAIESARAHINLASYIIAQDEIGERLATMLVAKRTQGVVVNVMYDSIGSIDTPKEYFQRLREAGIAVCEFNPVNPLKARAGWRLNNRNHRKLLIVDGRRAFTGGINISGVYSVGSFGSGRKHADSGWRDTHIQVDGPVVAQMQRLFLEDWQRQCKPPSAVQYVVPVARAGNKVLRLVAGSPEDGPNQTYTTLLSAIDHAEKTIHLTYGYFVPDPAAIEALVAAARRGVDVVLVLPGFSDFWAPLYAGRSHYDELLLAGVRIFERRDALLHAKTAVIDGVWSAVGSTNLDWRSLLHNYEVDIVVFDDAFATQMTALFQRDVQHSTQIRLETWNQRGSGSRFKEWLARRMEYFL